MPFVLVEILPAIVIAALLGLLIGWLVWRWRRRVVTITEWNELSGAANRASADLASAEAANAELTNERTALSKEVSALTSKYETSQTQLGETTRSRDVLRGQVEERDHRVSMLESNLGEANTTIARYQNIEGENGQLRNQVDSSSQRIGELEAQLGRSQSELQERSNALMASHEQVNAKDAELARLRTQIEADEGELASRSGKIDELKAAVAASAATAAAMKVTASDNDALTAELREARNGVDVRQARIAELEGSLGGARTDLDGAHRRIGELEDQLDGAQNEVTVLAPYRAAAQDQAEQLRGANDRITGLETELTEMQQLRNQLQTANGRVDELDNKLTEMQQLRNQLQGATNRVGQLESQVDASAASLERKESTIIDLRKQLAAKQAEAEAVPEPLREVESSTSDSWKVGKTKLGTAGASHTDDLQVVKGIGPEMEKLLNSFDITSWEQLAALTPEEVETVDFALADFRGRITRDAWVAQAGELVKEFPDREKRPGSKNFSHRSSEGASA